MAAVGNTVFFTATDGTDGVQLWTSDGTEAGTHMVTRINPTGDAFPSGFGSHPVLVAFGNSVFFSATNGTDGIQFWKSDGTATGTTMVDKINPTGDASPGGFTPVGSELYFVAQVGGATQLWKTDGSSANTMQVQGLAGGTPNWLAAVGSTLYLVTTAGDNTSQLWKTDGTPTGAVSLKTLTPGLAGFGMTQLTAVGGTLYFEADDGTTGHELWKSDGSPAGTILVKDINPGSASSMPFALRAYNGQVLFDADDGTHSLQLWRSDGTAAGTTLFTDTFSRFDPDFQGVKVINNQVFFEADDGIHGAELFTATPGTSVASGALQFSTSALSILETAGSVQITVTRTGGSSGAVSVHYATSDGSGVAGVNYVPASGTLNFADGEVSRSFTITVLNDGVAGGNKTVNLTLSAPTGGATLGVPAAAVLTILDVPPLPVVATDVTGQVSFKLGKTTSSAAAKINQQVVKIKNTSRSTLQGPLTLVVTGLAKKAKLKGSRGVTAAHSPLGSPFLILGPSALAPGASLSVTLVFTNAPRKVHFKLLLLAGSDSV
jgi:ELWxxDGT repeat protein